MVTLNPEQQKILTDANAASNYKIADTSSVSGVDSTSQAISPESLGNATLYNLPESKTPTVPSAITSQSEPITESAKLQLEREKAYQDRQDTLKAQENSFKSIKENILGVIGSRSKREEEANISTLSETARKAADSLTVSQRAQTNELRALDGSGLTDVQRAQQQREINRRYAFEQADLQLSYHLANSDLNAAQSAVDRRIKLELEPLQIEYEFAKSLYDEAKDDLDKEDQRLFDLKIKDIERKETAIKDKGDAINSIISEAMKNGVAIPSNIIASMNSAKDASGVYSAASQGGLSLENVLDKALKTQQLNNAILEGQKKSQDIQTTANEASNLVSTALDETSNLLNLTNSILSSKYLPNVTGAKTPGAWFSGFLGNMYGSPTVEVQNQIKQLRASLSLENRQKLKGSGAISDFEAKVLERASSAFTTGLNNADAVKQLKQIKGVMSSSNGLATQVKITDPKTGQSRILNADRNGINQAIADGLIVEYQ